MKISNSRRFSEALGSWMHFEACCFRAGLFSESSFKAAIGNVASSLHASHPAARVHADYELPAIQRVLDVGQTPGSGRKKSVDFALIFDNGRDPPSDPEFLIEAKWAGSSHCSTANIIADFIRLALMKRAHPNAVCLFVLAGHHLDVSAILSKAPFAYGTFASNRIKFASKSQRKFVFNSSCKDHRGGFGGIINVFHETKLAVPSYFVVSGTDRYPLQSSGGTIKFQSIAWELCGVSATNLLPNGWPVPAKKEKNKQKEK